MWDDIQIQYSEAGEIAEALIKDEVKLSQLRSIPAFANKADLVEDEVWEHCKSQSSIQRYLVIYPNGKHVADVEDILWETVLETKKYEDYLKSFPNGKHKTEVEELQAARRIEDEAWHTAEQIDTVESYRTYLEKYPKGMYSKEAEDLISAKMVHQKANIIRNLSQDRNAYPLNYIKNVLRITKEDLFNNIRDSHGVVRNEIFSSWDKQPQNLSLGKTPDRIPEGCTEVYFWGVPGSGKTCAMAAILSRARQMGCFSPRMGEGLRYMNELSTIFIGERERPAVCLPPPSDVDTTQYLPLTLNEKIEGKNGKSEIKPHNLSVIEISGEIFECFSCEVEGIPFKSAEHKETYEHLKNYLKSDANPKYHFFVIDSKPLKDSDQMRYLQNAALYFSSEGVFNSTTQGISLIVTKSDVLSSNRNQWAMCAENAAMTYFSSLVTQLKLIVGDPKLGGLGLSDGTIQVIPLSIGEVFFQSLCLFDPEPASVLVNLLMEYSKVAETNDWKKKTRRFLRK